MRNFSQKPIDGIRQKSASRGGSAYHNAEEESLPLEFTELNPSAKEAREEASPSATIRDFDTEKIVITAPQGVMQESPSPPPAPSFFQRIFRIRKFFSRRQKFPSGEDTFPPEWKELKSKRGLRFLWWGVGAGAVCIVVFIVLLSTVFSRLTVTVKPRVERIPIPDFVVAIDSSVNKPLVSQKVVPAEKMEFTKKSSEEFESSGKEFVEEKARGRVKIYNRFSSSPQSLVASTRFAAKKGVLFRISTSVTIPGAKIEEGKIVPQFVEADLFADTPGEESNISGEVTLTIPGFQGTAKSDGFYAVAADGFRGGFRGEARVVSAGDLKAAQEKVSKTVYDGLKQETTAKIPPHVKFLEALREIQIVEVSSPKEKTRADRFSVETSGRSRTMVFREKDVIDLLGEALLKGDATKTTMGEASRLEYQIRNVDFEKGKATLVMRGELTAKRVVVGEELVSAVQGRKEGSIVELLKGREELGSFRLTFFPFWIARAPSDLQKIRVVTEEP